MTTPSPESRPPLPPPSCLSTHGLAGWAPGSQIIAPGIVLCSACGKTYPLAGTPADNSLTKVS